MSKRVRLMEKDAESQKETARLATERMDRMDNDSKSTQSRTDRAVGDATFNQKEMEMKMATMQSHFDHKITAAVTETSETARTLTTKYDAVQSTMLNTLDLRVDELKDQ